MPLLDQKELRQFRLLLFLPLLAGLYFQMTASSAIQLKDAWPDGPAQIVVGENTSGNLEFRELHEKHKKKATHVVINEATHEELMQCPGIGTKTASLILTERQFGQFVDWRDLQDRVKNIGEAKILRLQETGVKLSR